MTSSASCADITQHTPLYTVTLKIQQFPFYERMFPQVLMYLMRKVKALYMYDLPSLIHQYVPPTFQDYGVRYSEDFLLRQCFTHEESRAIDACFPRHPNCGTTVDIQPVMLPVSKDICASDMCGNAWDDFDFSQDVWDDYSQDEPVFHTLRFVEYLDMEFGTDPVIRILGPEQSLNLPAERGGDSRNDGMCTAPGLST